ncbi:MAG: glycoside hydrolase family 3 N-terminal domain-containing protein, partial [bacterium]|nr:glycoside hydrolase family 3 N-terminal domain-containing protein [bacterium]
MNRKLKNTLLLAICSLGSLTAQTADFPFRDPSLPLEVRVKDIISRLTLEEKVELMKHEAPAVPRLGIPAYNWWNEALHGVARTKEKVTVFPQAIGMAATFDTEALQQMGDITSSEGRALFNEDLKRGKTGEIYRGLTYWTPNINIFRDPRWGRGQETYGEDPYLTAKMGSAIVRGLEGTDPYYLKAVACAKHYAVHSGPEGNRHSYDARVSAYDLWDTYLPAFRELITKAKVHGVMCAYNR